MKRIFMTTDAVGGVWTYTSELVRALAAHDIEVSVAVMGPAPTRAQRRELEDAGNVIIHHAAYALEWQDDPWGDVDAASDWLLGLADIFSADVIHLNGYAHAALPWQAPVLVTAHSCVLTWWRDVYRKAAAGSYAEYRRRVRQGLQAAGLVITPTRAFRTSLEREYQLRLRGSTIFNARDAARFRPDVKEAVILSAGRLWDPAKNLEMLGSIAPYLDWPVHVAGESQLPSHVPAGAQYLGRLSTSQLASCLGRAAIYAAPARYEPFGLSILEAALSACALVLGDVPSLRELWEECAVFVAPEDGSAWIAALNELARDHAKRERLQMRALRRASQFTPESQAIRYLSAYRRAGAARSLTPQHAYA
jgi:glycogen synthase